MNLFIRSILSFLVVVLAGCTLTTTYLVPEASKGTLNIDPCLGSPYAISFSPENQKWVSIMVETQWLNDRTMMTITFNSAPCFGIQACHSIGGNLYVESEQDKKIVMDRRFSQYIIEASQPTVTLILPDGKTQLITVPVFQSPFDLVDNAMPQYGPNSYLFKSHILISSGPLETFLLRFPDITVNGERVDIPEIRFIKKQADFVFPIVNC